MTPAGQPHWVLTRHAYDRSVEMGLTHSDVVRVIEQHHASWSSHRRPGEEHRRVYVRDAIAVVANTMTRMVITILHHTQEQYVRPEKVEVPASGT